MWWSCSKCFLRVPNSRGRIGCGAVVRIYIAPLAGRETYRTDNVHLELFLPQYRLAQSVPADAHVLGFTGKKRHNRRQVAARNAALTGSCQIHRFVWKRGGLEHVGRVCRCRPPPPKKEGSLPQILVCVTLKQIRDL